MILFVILPTSKLTVRDLQPRAIMSWHTPAIIFSAGLPHKEVPIRTLDANNAGQCPKPICD